MAAGKASRVGRIVRNVGHHALGLTGHGGQRVIGMQYDDPGSDRPDPLDTGPGEAEPATVAQA